MKNRLKLLLLFLAAVICIAPSCKKSNPAPVDPLSQLPPATQTGANTFGCLVNGQAFLPSSNFSSGQTPYQCNYIYTNGGYNFFVEGSNQAGSNYISEISLGTVLLPIHENQTLNLEDYNVSGKACGAYDIILRDSYTTKSNVKGQLYISKLDSINQIVAGTFFFNAVNSNGDTVHVTNGRFDMKYTR